MAWPLFEFLFDDSKVFQIPKELYGTTYLLDLLALLGTLKVAWFMLIKVLAVDITLSRCWVVTPLEINHLAFIENNFVSSSRADSCRRTMTSASS